MRTIIEIPDEDVRVLDVIARKTKRSRAEIIRGCIRQYLDMAADMEPITHDVFGRYADVFTEDAVAAQEALRAGWSNTEEGQKIIHDHAKAQKE